MKEYFVAETPKFPPTRSLVDLRKSINSQVTVSVSLPMHLFVGKQSSDGKLKNTENESFGKRRVSKRIMEKNNSEALKQGESNVAPSSPAESSQNCANAPRINNFVTAHNEGVFNRY